jgi:multidrug efflux pump subunit AcrA (membrane-fusion protein)
VKQPLDSLNGYSVMSTVAVDGSGALNTLNGITSAASQTASALSALGVAQSNYAAQQVAAAQAAVQAAQQAQAAAQQAMRSAPCNRKPPLHCNYKLMRSWC